MKKVITVFLFLSVFLFVIMTSSATADVAINEANFPDGSFRSFVHQYDIGERRVEGSSKRLGEDDGILSSLELSWVTGMVAPGVSLKGIEHFTALEVLGCKYNGLDELNVSNNTALKQLDCEGNKLTELNISGLGALEHLHCYENYITSLNVRNNRNLKLLMCGINPLGRLDVSLNPLLEVLCCGSNDLSELDVTNNPLLTRLDCWGNKLTELDLSHNPALTTLLAGVQNVEGLKVKATAEGYEVDLKDYVSKLENIVAVWGLPEKSINLLSFNKDTGIALFNERPREICYFYDTHSPNSSLLYNNGFLYVEIKPLMTIDVIERRGATDNIIHDITDSYYVGSDKNAITEESISNLSGKLYGKKGFTADGNSRLIVRTQTRRPGTVTFSLNKNIGVTLEKLTNRSKSNQIHTTQIGEELYQASAVLVAPEMFPSTKNFPSADFSVNVKFTADATGEEISTEEREAEENVKLEIHAAPVMLLHSFGKNETAQNTFVDKNNNGVWPVLSNSGFQVFPLNYRGTRGYSQLLEFSKNEIFLKVAEVLKNYIRQGIVCTKVDFVGYGMGGLVAKYFCLPDKYLSDGNYYSSRSYGQGMVRRIVTIATPHRGTPWGNYMIGSFEVLRANEKVGYTRLAYRVLTWLYKTKLLGISFFGGIEFGAIDNDTSSIWEDIAMPGGPSINPVNVPMYSIYGKVKNVVDKANFIKSSLFTSIGMFLKYSAKLAQIARFLDKFKVTTLVDILEDVQIARIEKQINEISEILGNKTIDMIGEQVKISLQTGTEANFIVMIEMFQNMNDHLKLLDVTTMRAAIDKYNNLRAILDEFGNINDKLNMINLPLKAVDLFKGFNLPSWFVSAAQVLSVAFGGGVGLIDTFFELPFAMLELFFGDEDHDLFVSESSAGGDFIGASTSFGGQGLTAGFYDWRYRHESICKQNDVGEEVARVLKEYPIDRLKLVRSEKATKHSIAFTSRVKNTVSDSEDDYNIELEPNEIFETHFTISADKSAINVSDLGFITFTATVDSSVNSDEVYVSLKQNDNDLIFPMYKLDENTFELVIEFTSFDTGIINAHCFTHNINENKIYTSNTVQIIIKPDLEISEILFTGNNDVIFMESGAEAVLPLYAKTFDDILIDISSPLMGTVWTVDNSDILEIREDGRVHALKDGSTYLTAEYRGFKASIGINIGELVQPEIVTNKLNDGIINNKYEMKLNSSGSLNISWRIIDGYLPTGLKLSSEGCIYGVPTETGNFSVTVEALNIAGTQTKELTLNIKNLSEFQDANFQSFIFNQFDKNGDGSLSMEEINDIREIRVNDNNITSLNGIEYFPNLYLLECSNNNLTELDVSHNANLLWLTCNGNQLTEIDVTKNLLLKGLALNGNHITNLDVSNNIALEELYCGWNELTTLDVSKNTELRVLFCNDSGLTALDVSNNPNLESLDCRNNAITTLDVSKNLFLKFLWCPNNPLKKIDVSHNTLLEHFDCSDTLITEIDVSNNPALTFLWCRANDINNLDVTKNKMLEHLECGEDNLTTLDVSQNVCLVYLECNKNQLTALDVSKNTALKELMLRDNRIANIDVSNNNVLENLDCNNNPIGTLDIRNNPDLINLGCGEDFGVFPNKPSLSELDISNNPLLENVYLCGNHLSAIDVSNNPNLLFLDLQDNNLSEIDISKNPALTYLNLNNTEWNNGTNHLTTLDISKNLALEHLHCASNDIQALNVSQHTALRELRCWNNNIPEIDVRKSTELEALDCGGNNINNLDLSQNLKLKELYCWDNNLTVLNLSNNSDLEALNCDFNQLTALDVSNCMNLTFLKCQYNNLTMLDASNKIHLRDLRCDDNQLTSLNVTNCAELEMLWCQRNNLTVLDVKDCKLLKELGFRYNNISEIDVSNNTELIELNCPFNSLKQLNINNNTKLEILDCGRNELTALNVSNNPELRELWCFGNSITILDVSHNPKLEYLDCNSNNLAAIDVSNNTALKTLECDFNNITELDLSKNVALEFLDCNDNQITELDVSNNPNLQIIEAYNNAFVRLVLGDNTKLIELNCSGNPELAHLDISGCPNLTEFTHDDNLTIYDGNTKPEFKTHSLMLDGQIGVNFYMDLPEISGVDYNDGQKCYMEFDIKGDNTANNPQPFDEEFMNRSRTYYGFRCYTNSVQMADPITAIFHYGDNQTIIHEYSVSEYLDTAISKTTSDTERELMKAIKDYGYYAQQYLSRYHNWTVGVEHLAMSYANEYSDEDIEEARLAVENYSIERDVGNSGIEKVTYSLNLDSETIINVYLTVSSNYTGSVSAYLDGGTENVAVKQQDGRYKIEISDIAAHLLGKTYVLTVNAGETFYVKVSALSYVKTVLNASQAQTDEKKTVTALYNYYITTMDYRKSQGYND